MTDAVLTGIVFASSLIASLFFAKFWRLTRDTLFLAFALSFAIEGITRLAALYVPMPSDALPAFYIARLLGYATIVIAVIRKNRGRAANRSGASSP